MSRRDQPKPYRERVRQLGAVVTIGTAGVVAAILGSRGCNNQQPVDRKPRPVAQQGIDTAKEEPDERELDVMWLSILEILNSEKIQTVEDLEQSKEFKQFEENLVILYNEAPKSFQKLYDSLERPVEYKKLDTYIKRKKALLERLAKSCKALRFQVLEETPPKSDEPDKGGGRAF
jgi:hypothetical protein